MTYRTYLFAISMGLSSYAYGTANITLDSSSFMYQSNARGTSATSVSAGYEGSFETSALGGQALGKVDASAITYLNNKPTAAYNPKELYAGLHYDLNSDTALELNVGRRIYEWSKVDQEWQMMSLWSPRFTWDELHPETVGLTGAFLEFKNKNLQILAYGSPIAIPEMGTPVTQENNNIVSPNPFWHPLPTQLPVQGVQTNLQYTLATPSIQSILLRPNAALRIKGKLDNGLWSSVNAGVMPVNITEMAAEYYADSSSANVPAQVIIRPEFPMRTIYTGELGYDSPTHDWNLWLSGSHEEPFNFQNQITWLNPVITPATVLSSGAGVQLTPKFWFNGGVIFIHEDSYITAANAPNVSVSLPSRFPLKQGVKVGGTWRLGDNDQSNLTWIQDLINQNHFISADYQHRIRSSNLLIGVGADVMIAESATGWVGQYYGDDRVRGWLKYAF